MYMLTSKFSNRVVHFTEVVGVTVILVQRPIGVRFIVEVF